jgi:uncharacterized protein (DUF1697 family)
MKYVAFLRGINVGGNRMIRMADLCPVFTGLGFTDVTAYIRSGNVRFSTERAERETLRQEIEAAIAKRFGFEVPVMVRTVGELAALAAASPFKDLAPSRQGLDLYRNVGFLERVPTAEEWAAIIERAFDREHIALVNGDALSAIYRAPGETSPFALNVLEKTLKIKMTVRKLNTLEEMAQQA